MPILGLQSSSRNISSYGTVKYPGLQLGVWHIGRTAEVPEESSLVVTQSPVYSETGLLYNPGFEADLLGWVLYTPPDETPLLVDILLGYVGKSAVMVSDELGYRGGLNQYFSYVSPNTTFHFKAVIKTVDVEALEASVLYYGVYDAEGNWYGGSFGRIYGSNDWALYEVSFTTPNVVTSVGVYPALVYNRGEVWMDEVSLIQEGWIPPAQSVVPVILNWVSLYPYPWGTPIESESEIKRVGEWLKLIPIENFWGILFIREEFYRTQIGFNDDVNTTWFGERLLGYPLYLAESPGATVDDWKDEMYLRMIMGFYNYFSPLTKVGITWGATHPETWDRLYGKPATAFIQQNYDFLFIYPYSDDLDDWLARGKPYLTAVEEVFLNQKKFWIITRPWDDEEDWELEAIALEMMNAFDRNIPVLSYHVTEPAFEGVWPLMLKAIELYDSKAPYYEKRVYGKNLLTGHVGDTYGWVEVS